MKPTENEQSQCLWIRSLLFAHLCSSNGSDWSNLMPSAIASAVPKFKNRFFRSGAILLFGEIGFFAAMPRKHKVLSGKDSSYNNNSRNAAVIPDVHCPKLLSPLLNSHGTSYTPSSLPLLGDCLPLALVWCFRVNSFVLSISGIFFFTIAKPRRRSLPAKYFIVGLSPFPAHT